MPDLTDKNGNVLFSEAELRCRGSGGFRLAPGFAEHLVRLRLAWDRPMVPTSCCRSASYNVKVGGHLASLHVYDSPVQPSGGTCAVDIRVANGTEARELAMLAMRLGWSVGVPKSGFLHLDRRDIAGLARSLFGY